MVCCLAALAGCRGASARRVIVGAGGAVEQRIVGEIVALRLEDEGLEVERRFDLGRPVSEYDALLTAEVTVYPAHAATFFMEVLKRPGIASEELMVEQVRLAYEAAGVKWIPLGYEASAALALPADEARRRNVKAMSGLMDASEPWRLAVERRFNERPSGLPWLQRTYRIRTEAPQILERDQIRERLKKRQINLVACSATDPLLDGDEMLVLEDDLSGVMRNAAGLAVRTGALQDNARLEPVLAVLGGKITAARMRRMASEVVFRGRQPSAVAVEFLRASGL